MTRTSLMVLTIALPAWLMFAPPVHADDAAAPAETQAQDQDQTPRERVADRMRQRRAAENADRPERDHPGEGRGPMAGPPDDDRPHPPLTEAQRQQALTVLRELNPDFAEKIQDALKTNPERARRALQRFGPRLLDLAELKKTDPDLYKLKLTDQQCNFQTFRLVRQLHEAREQKDDAQVKKTTDQLRNVLDKHFDVRLKLREHELAMLEKRIDELRKDVKDHHQRKQQLIDEEIKQLSSDAPPPPPPPPEAAPAPEAVPANPAGDDKPN